MALTSPGGPLAVPLLTNQTVDETLGASANCAGRPYVEILVWGSNDTISSGVITIEEAPTQTFAGSWSSITTVNASDVTAGACKTIHLPTGAYAFVRTRISTVIGGGGNVSTQLQAC